MYIKIDEFVVVRFWMALYRTTAVEQLGYTVNEDFMFFG